MFLRLGALGFGGPAAHIALIEAEAVRRRAWLTHADFLDLLAICNLLPGPTSSQLVMALGRRRAGDPGALVAGLSFLAPSLLLMIGLSAIYFSYGILPGVGAFFAGVQPVVVALVGAAAWRLARTAVKDGLLGAAALFGLAVTLLWPAGQLPALLVAGGIGAARFALTPQAPAREGNEGAGAGPLTPEGDAASSVNAVPRTAQIKFRQWVAGAVFLLLLLLVVVNLSPDLLRLLTVFGRAGLLLFGGGYVLIPLMRPAVVDGYGWLTPQQFLDGVALGQSTPGPIVTTVAFVGYRVAGLAGALVATAAVYLPAFIFISAALRLTPALLRRPAVRAALAAVGATVAGAVAGAGVLLAFSLILPWQWVVLAGAVLAVARTKIAPVWLIVAGGLIGIIGHYIKF